MGDIKIFKQPLSLFGIEDGVQTDVHASIVVREGFGEGFANALADGAADRREAGNSVHAKSYQAHEGFAFVPLMGLVQALSSTACRAQRRLRASAP